MIKMTIKDYSYFHHLTSLHQPLIRSADKMKNFHKNTEKEKGYRGEKHSPFEQEGDLSCINIEVDYSRLVTEYRKYTMFPPIGYYALKIRPLNPKHFIINISDFSSVILSVIENKTINVYVQSVFGTREYAFSKKHLCCNCPTIDALRLGYNSFICDLVPSQQSLEFENREPLDKIFSKINVTKNKGFLSRTIKSLYRSLQNTTTANRTYSVSTDMNTAFSFLDLEIEYNNVLEQLCTKKDMFVFNMVQNKFGQILPNDYIDVEESIVENNYSVDVIVENDPSEILDIIDDIKDVNTKHPLFGTPLESQDFDFLSSKKKATNGAYSFKSQRRPSNKKLKSCLIEFVQTQNNYHMILESFYTKITLKSEGIEDLKVQKVLSSFIDVLQSERVVFYYLLKIIGVEDSAFPWDKICNVEKDKTYYQNVLLYGFDQARKATNMEAVCSNVKENSTCINDSPDKDKHFILTTDDSIDSISKIVRHLLNTKPCSFVGNNLNAGIEQIVDMLDVAGKLDERIEKIFLFFYCYIKRMDKYRGFFTIYHMHNITPTLQAHGIDPDDFEGGLDGVFILPVQRIVRYQQFLGKFYQHSNMNITTNNEVFLRTLSKLKDFIVDLDSERFCFESGRKAFLVQKRVENCPHSILNVKRAYKKQLNADVSGIIKLSFFLYNDILMIAARDGNPVDIFSENDVKFKFMKYLPLEKVRIIQMSDKILKFMLTEEVTEKNVVNIPGSRVISSGDNTIETVMVHVCTRNVDDFLGDFFFFRNNEYSLNKQSKMFFDKIGSTFIFYHVINREKYDKKGSTIVLNFSDKKMNMEKEQQIQGRINKEISKFVIYKEKLVWNISKTKNERDKNVSTDENNKHVGHPYMQDDINTEHSLIECVIYSTKKMRIKPLQIACHKFRVTFRSLLLKSILIHTSFFPLGREKSSELRCNLIANELQENHSLKLPNDYKFVRTDFATLCAVRKCMAFIEQTIKKPHISDDVDDSVIGLNLFGDRKSNNTYYGTIKLNDLCKFLKKGVPSTATLEDIGVNKLTNIVATYFKSVMYDIFTYNMLKEIHSNLKNNVFTLPNIQYDRKLLYVSIFTHFNNVSKIIGLDVLVDLIEYLFIDFERLKRELLLQWLNFIFEKL